MSSCTRPQTGDAAAGSGRAVPRAPSDLDNLDGGADADVGRPCAVDLGARVHRQQRKAPPGGVARELARVEAECAAVVLRHQLCEGRELRRQKQDVRHGADAARVQVGADVDRHVGWRREERQEEALLEDVCGQAEHPVLAGRIGRRWGGELCGSERHERVDGACDDRDAAHVDARRVGRHVNLRSHRGRHPLAREAWLRVDGQGGDVAGGGDQNHVRRGAGGERLCEEGLDAGQDARLEELVKGGARGAARGDGRVGLVQEGAEQDQAQSGALLGLGAARPVGFTTRGWGRATRWSAGRPVGFDTGGENSEERLRRGVAHLREQLVEWRKGDVVGGAKRPRGHHHVERLWRDLALVGRHRVGGKPAGDDAAGAKGVSVQVEPAHADGLTGEEGVVRALCQVEPHAARVGEPARALQKDGLR
eukprot:scaffold3555_cov113-Isochrysis_galbana.AAC.1